METSEVMGSSYRSVCEGAVASTGTEGSQFYTQTYTIQSSIFKSFPGTRRLARDILWSLPTEYTLTSITVWMKVNFSAFRIHTLFPIFYVPWHWAQNYWVWRYCFLNILQSLTLQALAALGGLVNEELREKSRCWDLIFKHLSTNLLHHCNGIWSHGYRHLYNTIQCGSD